MANLPEKNITTVDKITSIPSNTNLYINANGEFRQATIDDVLKASPVIADSIANQFKNASGSPILLTDSADGTLIDFKAYGKSTQDGTPTPNSPQAIKSVGDMGYFDGELLQGAYSSSNGEITTNATYLCSKNFIPCNVGDEITLKYATSMRVVNLLYYDKSKTFITSSTAQTNVDKHTATAPTNAKYFKFNISESSTAITVSDAKHICVTINDKYAMIVKSIDVNGVESVKYIPISAPLRGLGEVTDVASLSECKVTRRFAEVVYDGSDEGWSGDNRPSIYVADIKKTDEPIAICTHFKNVKFGQNVNEFLNYKNGYLYFNVDTNLQDLTKWKAWLQANPITVIYELAEPTTESIEPIDVDTFEGVTHISVSDDADMEVEYPASKVAGIASIGWSKGRRAEYDLEQLKVQMLALQTTIVSTV